MPLPDVARELAKALNIEEVEIQIRQTDDKRTSVIDSIRLFTGLDANHAAEKFRDLLVKYPEVNARISHFKFRGQGQRETPVTDLVTLYEILMLLPGRMAAQCRRQAAQLMIRYLGGDLSLIKEVEENRALQERLATEDPTHPMRLFGEAVESAAAAADLEPPEVIKAESSEPDPQGDLLYGMRIPYQPNLLKVGHTVNILQREQSLSCGQTERIRAVVVFIGAGPLEKYVHRLLRDRQVQNEVFRVSTEELKLVVKRARIEYQRDLILEGLRVQVSSSSTEDIEEERARKRRRLSEDLDLEERQVALAHTKAMNSLELEERKARLQVQAAALREQEMSLREREARLVMEMEERKARLQMEIQERMTQLAITTTSMSSTHTGLAEVSPPSQTLVPEMMLPSQSLVPEATQPIVSETLDATPVVDMPPTMTPQEVTIASTPPEEADKVAKLLGSYQLVSLYRDATPKSDIQYQQHMSMAKMKPRAFNKALRELGFDVKNTNGFTGVTKGKLWVKLLT
jgi:hypothetical protein